MTAENDQPCRRDIPTDGGNALDLLPYVLAVLAAYLLGSIPTGYLLARMSGNVDLLSQGSRKTGTTNVLRTLGWKAAAVVFAGDFGKGIAAVLVARVVTGGSPIGDALAGLTAVAGHNYSLFIGFKGGRGVATGLGTLFVVVPIVATVCLVLATAIIAVTRYVSLGSILGAGAVGLLALVLFLTLGQPLPHVLYAVAGSLFVIASHRDNIGRLLTGKERKLGERLHP